MSGEHGDEHPTYNRGRRGSVDDTIRDFLNPKLEFHQNELPKGSNALQILIHQCEDEIHKPEDSEEDSDKDEEKIKRPSREYMGRRRNTISCNYSHNQSLERQFRKMSLAPIPEGERGRSTVNQLEVPNSPRARSLSPMEANRLRRNSIHHTDKGFGSTSARETTLK